MRHYKECTTLGDYKVLTFTDNTKHMWPAKSFDLDFDQMCTWLYVNNILLSNDVHKLFNYVHSNL